MGNSDDQAPKRRGRHSVHRYKSRAPNPRQEGYYTEVWKGVIRAAKKYARLSLIADNAFPDDISLTCQNALADAIHAHEMGELLCEDGMFVFPGSQRTSNPWPQMVMTPTI